MRSLKILVFAAYYHPFKGGYIESIHQWAKRLVEQGHEVTVVTCKVSESAESEVMDGVQIVRLPSWHWLNGTYPVPKWGATTRKILKKLKEERYDLVSTQTRFFPTSFLGAWFAGRHKIPLIHTERGGSHSIVEKAWIRWASRLIDHTLGRWVVRRAARNVGVSEAACEFLKHLGARNTVCIHNGVESIDPLTPEQRTAARHRHDLNESDTVLLFVGRLIYAKGVQDVLEILPELIRQSPNLRCVLVGAGPYRETLEQFVREHHLEPHVRFVGEQPFEQVKTWLQMADLMVNPSHSEGLPRSVLEGAAAGLPVVATDTGGTREIIEEKISGRLVQVQNPESLQQALLELLHHPEQAHGYGRAARARIEEKFKWEKVVAAYVDLIQEIV